jgi:hypothetical protein
MVKHITISSRSLRTATLGNMEQIMRITYPLRLFFWIEIILLDIGIHIILYILHYYNSN